MPFVEPTWPKAGTEVPRAAGGGRVNAADDRLSAPEPGQLLEALDGVNLRLRPRGRDLSLSAWKLGEAV